MHRLVQMVALQSLDVQIELEGPVQIVTWNAKRDCFELEAPDHEDAANGEGARSYQRSRVDSAEFQAYLADAR